MQDSIEHNRIRTVGIQRSGCLLISTQNDLEQNNTTQSRQSRGGNSLPTSNYTHACMRFVVRTRTSKISIVLKVLILKPCSKPKHQPYDVLCRRVVFLLLPNSPPPSPPAPPRPIPVQCPHAAALNGWYSMQPRLGTLLRFRKL